MRVACCLLLSIVLAGGFAQASVGANTLQIAWNVPTNELPKSVWIYKCIAQTFAPAVISNLITSGSFTLADETNLLGQPASSRYFYSKDGKRQLGIVPTYGYIFYTDSNAERRPREIAVAVPNDDEAYQLGLEYLQRFGIDRSQLVSAGTGPELKVERTIGKVKWFDQATGTNVETVYMRSVYFRRQINGFDLTHDGIEFQFGNHGALLKMEIIWRGWEPYELNSTLSPDELVEELRSKQGQWLPAAPKGPIKKISIYDVQLLYKGFPVRESDDMTRRILDPIVRLKTQIDTDGKKTYSIFECPIYGAKRH